MKRLSVLIILIITVFGFLTIVSASITFAATDITKIMPEEVKLRIAERVRVDSRDSKSLTPVDGLYAEIGWDRGVVCSPEEIRNDPRYEDIKTVTVAKGETFFYSTQHMSDYYALLLARVAADDLCATIAETVRDESKRYPRPTNALFFREKLLGMSEADLKVSISMLQQRPEFSDIKAIVHPTTSGFYLYSNQYLDADTATSLINWQEVVKDANP